MTKNISNRIIAAFNYAEKNRGHYLVYFKEGYGYEMSTNCNMANGVNIFFEGIPKRKDLEIWKNLKWKELPKQIQKCILKRELESL